MSQKKVPVDEVKIDILTEQDVNTKKKIVKKNNFILVINDFYYFDSANDLKKVLREKIKVDNISIKKINNNKYRLFAGPFKSFNTLKNYLY